MSASDISQEDLAAIVEQITSGDDPYPLPSELLQENELAAVVEAAVPESVAVDTPAADAEPEVVNKSLQYHIMQLSMGQKIKLALKGNRDARTILIRDASHIIPRFVLQNPRITDDEIAGISRNRNVDADLLRIIGDSKDWSRMPQVRSGLVGNPKTPVVIALRFVNSLPERELRLLAKSKNVQSAVASKAKRLIIQRQSSTGKES